MSAEKQTEILAKYIQENYAEEITDGGAGDVAIKIIEKLEYQLYDKSELAYAEQMKWLDCNGEKNHYYRALKEIVNAGTFGTDINSKEVIRSVEGEIAYKALYE